ncbi:sensor domain-containing protein [Catenulispora sp. NF23]|uniref:sensor histidine kinase n=1 Tax=Catenulispora pinistramenti TaxID=2705254 RepID=UPI001BA6E572|nr:histidine kinase [Catenulispora pinistramenti]MBS2532479.1 sensor domain-containing protein [Catenulispora pinistramenti]
MPTTEEPRRTRWTQAGQDALFLVTGLPLWLGAMVMLTVWSKPLQDIQFLGAGLGDGDIVVRFSLSVVVIVALMLTIAPILTGWQRRRFRGMAGIEILEVDTPRIYKRQVRAALRSEALRRQVVYHLLAGPLIGVALAIMGFAIGISVFLVFQIPQHMLGIGRYQPEFRGQKFFAQVFTLLVSVATAYFAPFLLRLLTRADETAARRLLGPNETVVLAHRVQTLSDSRAAAIEAADAERRRIERDLHDGAQQRLMSLAVHLGIARKTLKDVEQVPPEAMAVIIDAHEQVKEAMAEIRNLVRGLHPAVLDDRGLDAALSGVAARSAVPVRLTVASTGPLSASVETVAYFVVSEALANVVKHSQAKQAEVDVERRDGLLLIRVGDDGVGGADARGGTGLTGLAQRVASVDGRLRLTSPSGGPTVLTAELPCGA